MKHLVLFGLFIVSLMATAAQADHHGELEGTFCSAATTDGTWAFFFGPVDIDANCKMARDGLASATRASIDATNSGYFRPQGWNEAVVQCGPLRSYFYERGALALQRAYDYAQLIRGQHCLFEVYYQD